MNPKTWIVIGALLGGVGVGIGAYHAHGLRKMLEKRDTDQQTVDQRMDNCATAVRYQMYHALALMIVGLLALQECCRGFHVAGILMILGMIGFSGGLYLIVFAGQSIHWSIVPAGGLLLLAGWLALSVSAVCMRRVTAT